MATRTLIGGPQLRARLQAIGGIPAVYGQAWAEDTKTRVQRTHPPAQRPESKRFTTKADKNRAGLYGAFWWVFVDRGTKAHDITGAGRKNPPNFLKFQAGGRTIFAKKVHLPRKARRPFITNAAKEALSGSAFADLVIKSWNRKRLGLKGRFL